MLMGPLPSWKKRKPEVDWRVYMKAVDVSTASPPQCSKSRSPAAELSRGCPSIIVGVSTSSSSQSNSVLSLVSRRSSRAAGTTPGGADVDDPSTPGDDDTTDTPVVLDGDDPATPYDAVAPAGAPVIQDNVDPAIPDAVAPASSGDGDSVVPGADAPKCDGDPVMPSADASMTLRACDSRVPGDLVP